MGTSCSIDIDVLDGDLVVSELIDRVQAFGNIAHVILSRHETSPSRVITLDDTRRKLAVLSLRQDDLFHQAIRCVEMGLYRPAHVMAWAAFVDYIEAKLAADGLKRVYAQRPSWSKWKTIECLRENVPEQQLVEVAHDVGLLGKTETKALLGLLSTRNECAHPTSYNPSLNESLGYISSLLHRISNLETRNLP